MAQPETLRSKPEEVLSPYKLLIAVLIREYIRLRRELTTESSIPKTISLAKEKERDDCRNYLLQHGVKGDTFVISAKESYDTMRLLQHLIRAPEREFSSLIRLIRLVLVKPHFILFRRIVELLRKEDQDEVAKYVEANLSQVIQAAKVEITSGNIFVQTVKLLYEEMGFAAAERFGVQLTEYIECGYDKLDEICSNYSTLAVNVTDIPDPEMAETFVTESQTEYILGKEMELIESNPLAAGDRSSTEDQVGRVLNLKPVTAYVAYVQFLDSIRRKNYPDAVDAIYRYGVLKGIPENGRFLGLDLSPAGLQQGEASLQLCIMHYNAGHSALALQALKECIFLAQERGDTHLLCHCMYWLTCLELNNNQYEKLYRGARGGDYPRFLEISRQFAATMARFDALTGIGLLRGLGDLNLSESVSDGQLSSISLIQQYTSRASLWKMYGFTDLAAIYAQASVQILSGSSSNTVFVATDAVALSLGILLEQAIRLTDDHALEILLEYSNATFPVDSSKDWRAWGLAELIWKYQRAFNQRHLSTCEIIVDQFALISPTEASIRKAELLYIKDFMPKKAIALLDDLYQTSLNISAHVRDLTTFSTAFKLRILLLKSDILLRAGCGLEALEVAKEALGLVLNHHHVLLKALVQLQLGYIWQHLKELSQVKNCLALCFPLLSGCGYPIDQGRAWFLRAKVMSSQAGADKMEIKRCYHRALEAFAQCLSVEHMLQCLYSIADLFDQMGNTVERDRVSNLFLELRDRFPSVPCSISTP